MNLKIFSLAAVLLTTVAGATPDPLPTYRHCGPQSIRTEALAVTGACIGSLARYGEVVSFFLNDSSVVVYKVEKLRVLNQQGTALVSQLDLSFVGAVRDGHMDFYRQRERIRATLLLKSDVVRGPSELTGVLPGNFRVHVRNFGKPSSR